MELGHVAWNYKQQANDILKGKVIDRQHIASATMIEELFGIDNGKEIIEERTFYAF